MVAEYFIPIIDQSLPENEKRRLIDLLQKDMNINPKPTKTNSKLRSQLIKHITKKQG